MVKSIAVGAARGGRGAIGYDGPVRGEPFEVALGAPDDEGAAAATAAALRKALALPG